MRLTLNKKYRLAKNYYGFRKGIAWWWWLRIAFVIGVVSLLTYPEQLHIMYNINMTDISLSVWLLCLICDCFLGYGIYSASDLGYTFILICLVLQALFGFLLDVIVLFDYLDSFQIISYLIGNFIARVFYCGINLYYFHNRKIIFKIFNENGDNTDDIPKIDVSDTCSTENIFQKKKQWRLWKEPSVDELKDRLQAYYGNEYSIKRTRKVLLRNGFVLAGVAVTINLTIAFIWSLFIGFEHFLFICLFLATMLFFPTVIGTIIEYFFIVLEDIGFGIAFAAEIAFLFIYYYSESVQTSVAIDILLIVILCEWFTKQELTNKIGRVRSELSNKGVGTEIITSQVIFIENSIK